MKANPTDRMTDDEIVDAGMHLASSALEQARALLKRIEKDRTDQPERLAKARSDAEEARGWALLEEPWDEQVTEVPALNADRSFSLPNTIAKELWGARLCFDILDCGDDYDRIDEVITRLLSTTKGDTGMAMMVMAAALSTIAGLVVPKLLAEIEQGGSNYDQRVNLAQARAKAWHGRVAELRGLNAEAAECGVKPIDAFDIGATALDDAAEQRSLDDDEHWNEERHQ